MERQVIPIMKDVSVDLNFDQAFTNDNNQIANYLHDLNETFVALKGMLDRINTLNEISVHTNNLVANTSIDVIKKSTSSMDSVISDIQIMNNRSKRTADEIDRLTFNGQEQIKNALEKIRLSVIV
jgi:hypothetical protein